MPRSDQVGPAKIEEDPEDLHFVQVAVAQWVGEKGMTYSLVGLTDWGHVYIKRSTGWEPQGNSVMQSKRPVRAW